ncbi:MAG: type II toxin-antitoxin system RelE/ParE family toxin [Clostridia bacterium]|nr:type II toxin-antitoxin system RelE/ParE family toxin [Clostridia bacterium]
MNRWEIRYLPEAIVELKHLNRSVQPEILKGIRKVAQNPGYPDGYGKPLGNLAGSHLAGLYKIKFKKAGLRVVYGLEIQDGVMTVIIISARADNAVYEEAEKRRLKYGL